MTLVKAWNEKNIGDVRKDRIAMGTIGADHGTPQSFTGSNLQGVIGPYDPRIVYTGGTGWIFSAGLVGEDLLSQSVQTTTAGLGMELSFIGTAISIIGTTLPGGGTAKIYIDGVLQAGKTRISTFVQNTLDPTPLDATITTINVNDTSSFPSAGAIIVDDEMIAYAGKTGTSFTGCVREGTKTHVIGSMIYLYSSTVDLYSVFTQHRIILWGNNLLPQGSHTVRIEVGNVVDRNPSSTSNIVYINGFITNGTIGAQNLNTRIDYIKYPAVPFDSSGYSAGSLGTPMAIIPKTTNEQVIGIMGVGAYNGGTFVPCFYSWNPFSSDMYLYAPSSPSTNLDVVITYTVLGPTV